MASFKRYQFLRTTRKVQTVDGQDVPAGTRVQVVKQDESGRYLVDIAGPTKSERRNGTASGAVDALIGQRILIGESRLEQTYRGRPVGSGAISTDEGEASE